MPGTEKKAKKDKFNPKDYLMKIRQKRKNKEGKYVETSSDYMEVKYRLLWFRHEHPAGSGWQIHTEGKIDPETKKALFIARIYDPQSRLVAMGHKTETYEGFKDYVEKAETGAIGRALAILGFGTQFTGGEFEEGKRIVDAPIRREEKKTGKKEETIEPI